jgi:hypothetical protein
MTDLDRFCGFCQRFLTDEQGRKLVIEPFQRQILSDYFDGAREVIVLLSKKNGKTSLFAALGLYHLLTVDFADLAILAASRDQAGKLLQQLTGLTSSARTDFVSNFESLSELFTAIAPTARLQSWPLTLTLSTAGAERWRWSMSSGDIRARKISGFSETVWGLAMANSWLSRRLVTTRRALLGS